MGRTVRQFFDDHATGYLGSTAGMQLHHRETARRIDAGTSGRILSIGGVWKYAEPASSSHVVIGDLSLAILRSYAGRNWSRVQADGLQMPFREASFDHVVLPLVLHHVAGRTAAEAQQGAREVIRVAARILRPGGRLWISEFCPSERVYALERFLVPLTRFLLDRLRTPLVVMHSSGYYEGELISAGFDDLRMEPIRPQGTSSMDWITPIIGRRWFKVPRFAYLAAPTLISGRRVGGQVSPPGS